VGHAAGVPARTAHLVNAPESLLEDRGVRAAGGFSVNADRSTGERDRDACL